MKWNKQQEWRPSEDPRYSFLKASLERLDSLQLQKIISYDNIVTDDLNYDPVSNRW